MRTSPECLPCFLRQADHVARLTDYGQEGAAGLHHAVARLLRTFDLDLSPPENAVALYRLLADLTETPDPFAALKQASNRIALAMEPRLREIIASSHDPLETAARLAIAGNIIDYGAKEDFDLAQAIDRCLTLPPTLDHFAWFREKLARAEKILYLADNCGELVFDRLFIEQLGKPVTLAVKAQPIINDALAGDAEVCGLSGLCRVIDNGTGCPGTPLRNCRPEFQQLFREADLIISKGQGNFETLSETAGPILFLLLIKCPVVLRHIAARGGVSPMAVNLGDLVMFAPESVPS